MVQASISDQRNGKLLDRVTNIGWGTVIIALITLIAGISGIVVSYREKQQAEIADTTKDGKYNRKIDVPVRTFYYKVTGQDEWLEDENPFGECEDYNKSYSWHMSRPDLHTVCDWLREIKGLHVVVSTNTDHDGWISGVQIKGEYEPIEVVGEEDAKISHDGALAACIDWAVEHLIKNGKETPDA